MAQNICRGCVKPLTTNNLKNIFTDELSLNEPGKCIKISTGMEMITGQRVFKANDLPENMCENCFKKLGICVNFRSQLLNSFNTLFKNSTNQEIIYTYETKDNEMSIKNANLNECERMKKVTTEDQTNVDDINSSSTILVDDTCDEISEDEGIMRSLKEEQDNNNYDIPDSPITDSDVDNSYDNLMKTIDNDIESDIDVCSGEDDEILELDISNKKVETIELDHSSDSDIDVCDFEPSGKRTRNFATSMSPNNYF